MQAIVQSSIFGRLDYNPHFGFYEAAISEADRQVQITIKPEGESSLQSLLKCAEAVWIDRERFFENFRQHATSVEMLDEINAYLKSDEEGPPFLHPQQLIDMIFVPNLISITSDTRNGGKPSIAFDVFDEERIGEHSVSVFFDADGSVVGSEVIRLY